MQSRPYVSSAYHRALLVAVRLDAWWLIWFTLGQMLGLGVLAFVVLQVVGQVVVPELVGDVTVWCESTLASCGSAVAGAVCLQLGLMLLREFCRRRLDYIADERLDGSRPNYD